MYVCLWPVVRELALKGARSIAYQPVVSVMQLYLQGLSAAGRELYYFAAVTPILQAAHAS